MKRTILGAAVSLALLSGCGGPEYTDYYSSPSYQLLQAATAVSQATQPPPMTPMQPAPALICNAYTPAPPTGNNRCRNICINGQWAGVCQ